MAKVPPLLSRMHSLVNAFYTSQLAITPYPVVIRCNDPIWAAEDVGALAASIGAVCINQRGPVAHKNPELEVPGRVAIYRGVASEEDALMIVDQAMAAATGNIVVVILGPAGSQSGMKHLGKAFLARGISQEADDLDDYQYVPSIQL